MIALAHKHLDSVEDEINYIFDRIKARKRIGTPPYDVAKDYVITIKKLKLEVKKMPTKF